MDTPSQKIILLIEDGPAVSRSLQDGPQRDGFQLIWKDGVVAGVSYVRDHTPYLIILDVRLPGRQRL